MFLVTAFVVERNVFYGSIMIMIAENKIFTDY